MSFLTGERTTGIRGLTIWSEEGSRLAGKKGHVDIRKEDKTTQLRMSKREERRERGNGVH